MTKHIILQILGLKNQTSLLVKVSYTRESNLTEQVFHIISLEPVSERSMSKSFHEPRVQLVRIDMIGRELYDKT